MRTYYNHFVFCFLVLGISIDFFSLRFYFSLVAFYDFSPPLIFSFFMICVSALDFVLRLPLGLCYMFHTYNSPFSSNCLLSSFTYIRLVLFLLPFYDLLSKIIPFKVFIRYYISVVTVVNAFKNNFKSF